MAQGSARSCASIGYGFSSCHSEPLRRRIPESFLWPVPCVIQSRCGEESRSLDWACLNLREIEDARRVLHYLGTQDRGIDAAEVGEDFEGARHVCGFVAFASVRVRR